MMLPLTVRCDTIYGPVHDLDKQHATSDITRLEYQRQNNEADHDGQKPQIALDTAHSRAGDHESAKPNAYVQKTIDYRTVVLPESIQTTTNTPTLR